MLGWFAAFQPGLMSADSLEIWRQATTGGWLDIHPPLYTAGMWFSDRVVGSPSLLTLGQSLFLAAGISAVAAALVRLGADRRLVLAVAAVVALSPQVGSFSISLWKDVPYTAAFLFVAARVIDLARATMRGADVRARRAIWSLALWSSLAVALRQNGILLVIGLTAALVAVVRPHRRVLLLAGLVPLLVLGTLKVVVYRALDVTPSGSQPSLAIVLHDIAAGAHADPESFDAGDRALLERMAPFEVWRETYAAFGCSSANWEWDPRFRWGQLDGHSGEVLSLWGRIVADHPLLVARNRLCIGAIAFRPDNGGVALYSVSRGIDANSLGLETAPIIDSLTDPGRDALDALDDPTWQPITWRAAGWIYGAYILVAVAARRRRSWLLLLPALPLLMLQLSVFPVNPAQDARYMVPGLVLAVLTLPMVSVRPRGAPDGEAPALRERATDEAPVPDRRDELVST